MGGISLTSITIPNSVRSIGYYAFYGCSTLADVYYNGFLDDWNNILIDSYNTDLTNAKLHLKGVVSVVIDAVETSYATFSEAVKVANAAGKAVELNVLLNLESASIESDYKHTINLNKNTVNELKVVGEAIIKNGSVAALNVTGIVVTENVTIANTNAAFSGTEGIKGVYTSCDLGVTMVDGAQVRVGNGVVENGTIDSNSGLRFLASCDMNDTFVTNVIGEYCSNNTYTEGYSVGIAISAEGSDNVEYIAATKWQDEEFSVFSAAITGLLNSNFNRKFTARAYVEYEGVKLYSQDSVSRSMYQVVAGILKKGNVAKDMLDVLNAYVNQTGVRLTLATKGGFSARMAGEGAYTGEAFFTVGETIYEDGIYYVTLEAIGSAKIDVQLFNTYVRINNNNSLVSLATHIEDNGDGTYTLTFDYSSMN